LEKEIGVVKKERSKLKHILGIEHGNIPIQLDLWGNDKYHYTDTQRIRILKRLEAFSFLAWGWGGPPYLAGDSSTSLADLGRHLGARLEAVSLYPIDRDLGGEHA